MVLSYLELYHYFPIGHSFWVTAVWGCDFFFFTLCKWYPATGFIFVAISSLIVGIQSLLNKFCTSFFFCAWELLNTGLLSDYVTPQNVLNATVFKIHTRVWSGGWEICDWLPHHPMSNSSFFVMKSCDISFWDVTLDKNQGCVQHAAAIWRSSRKINCIRVSYSSISKSFSTFSFIKIYLKPEFFARPTSKWCLCCKL